MPARPHWSLEPGILTTAVAWDLAVGDALPEADPGAVLGRAVETLENYAPQHSRTARGVFGAAAAFLLPYLVWKGARWLLSGIAHVHVAFYQEVATLLLKAAVSIRPTVDAALEEEAAVPADPSKGPSATPSQRLTRLAHDLTGNVVGPLFYFAFLGVPGALAYRALRGVSDRWGRRRDDPLGTGAARMDGAASYVPARLSAAFLAGAAGVSGGSARAAWESGRREGARDRRSNDGWSEGALAGALGVRLDPSEGPIVNKGGGEPTEEDLARARRLFYLAAGGAVGVALAVVALRHAARRR